MGKDSVTVEQTFKDANADLQSSTYGACSGASDGNERPTKKNGAYLKDSVSSKPLHHYLELQPSVNSYHHYEDVSPKTSVRNREDNQYMDIE